MTSLHTEHRRLCNDLFDAIECGDLTTVDRCYAPDMTMWFNVTGATSTRQENLTALREGAALHRRRTYDDRQIHTFDDGFLVQYTTTVVTHRGDKRALSACLVAEVHDGRITKLMEYMDSGQFK